MASFLERARAEKVLARNYIIAVLAALALVFAWSWHVSRVDAAVDAARSALLAMIEDDRLASMEAAREAEAAHRTELAEIAVRHEQEMTDAQARADAVVDDLRDGSIRLRRLWQGCENATARVPAAPAAAAESDGNAELRAASAARIVRVGAQCDARIRGLQAALNACSGAGR